VRWELNDDTLAAVEADAKVAKLKDDDRRALLDSLRTQVPTVLTESSAALKLVRLATGDAGLKGKPLETAVLDALAVRDLEADAVTDAKGSVEPDPDRRDNENVPLPQQRVAFEADVGARLATSTYRTAVDDYLTTEVLPYVPDAWVDHDKTKIGYEVPLTRHFYVYVPPRPLEEIDAEIKSLEAEIQSLLNEVTE
jgi:type I restriction enzyme M protein